MSHPAPEPETHAPVLVRLSRSDQTVAAPEEDIRGRRVQDVDREDLGTVQDLLVDPDAQRVRMLVVSHGGLLGIGAQHVYLPVEAVTDVGDDLVRVSQQRERVAAAPVYDPELSDEPPLVDQLGYYGSVYGFYGYAPFWDDRSER